MKFLDRREFLVGCSAAIAAMAGSRFNTLAFAREGGDEDLLIYLFLRGGMDGLSLVPPIAGPDREYYALSRPTLRVPLTGSGAALPLDDQFGLHPAAQPLMDIFRNGELAVIHGVGLHVGSRSHFDSMQYIENGTPGDKTTASGWLARHLATMDLPDEIKIPCVSLGAHQQTSLAGDYEALNFAELDQFRFYDVGPFNWLHAQRVALRNLYSRSGWMTEAGLQTLDALDVVQLNTSLDYRPENGAMYPTDRFGEQLRSLAQLIKLGLGLRVAAIDLGGWDTHVDQGVAPGGYFSSKIENLARGLLALYTDLDTSTTNFNRRVTVIVQSEFGRRLRENGGRGTDHGHGNLMLLMGANVRGGVKGMWPGLHHDQLFDGADLEVLVDYRQILSEILVRRTGNTRIREVFPGFKCYEPLDIVRPKYRFQERVIPCS